MSAEHRGKISSANTGKTMGRQTEEHRRCGLEDAASALHRACPRGSYRTCLQAACNSVRCRVPWHSGQGDASECCVRCSKLSESMQKQWQGRKGAERLERFRAQVLQGCRRESAT